MLGRGMSVQQATDAILQDMETHFVAAGLLDDTPQQKPGLRVCPTCTTSGVLPCKSLLSTLMCTGAYVLKESPLLTLCLRSSGLLLTPLNACIMRKLKQHAGTREPAASAIWLSSIVAFVELICMGLSILHTHLPQVIKELIKPPSSRWKQLFGGDALLGRRSITAAEFRELVPKQELQVAYTTLHWRGTCVTPILHSCNGTKGYNPCATTFTMHQSSLTCKPQHCVSLLKIACVLQDKLLKCSSVFEFDGSHLRFESRTSEAYARDMLLGKVSSSLRL